MYTSFRQNNAQLYDAQPIGVFDSGVGGLSVWIEIRSQLPVESTIYFADQAHVPYGSRSLSEVREYATGITDFLINLGVKLIIVACNTASGAALGHLRSTFPQINFVGMEPAVKPAVENTHTGHIGVIATPTTFQGPLYQKLVHRYSRNVTIHTQICPGLVEAIEAGELDNTATEHILWDCLQPLITHNIDQLVLGCTHYPFILSMAKRLMGNGVTIIDPAPAVARQTRKLLQQNALLRINNHLTEHQLITSASTSHLRTIARSLVGYTGPIYKAMWLGNQLCIVDE
jgi:glutamate racemase